MYPKENDMVFDHLIAAAAKGRWDFVDAHISTFANELDVMFWVTEVGLDHADGNVRDLSVSILEKSSAPLPAPVRSKLLKLMAEDENRYVRFRSAFALYVRGERSPEVMAKMEGATKDPEVDHIAKTYLEKK